MKAYNSVDVKGCQLVAIIGSLNRNEMGYFGQMIDYDPDGVMSLV